MNPSQGSKSKRDLIRDEAERVLRAASKPLHNAEIASVVLPRLGLADSVSPKDLNTALHEDPSYRFERVGRGTWTLSK